MTCLLDAQPAAAKSEEGPLAHLLACLHHDGDFDFSEYSQANISRHVATRMTQVGISDMDAYTRYLQETPGEAVALCNTIWINVTSFFRDPSVWTYLQECALPKLLTLLPVDAPIRIWSAGCSSGQEPYSIAMLLSAALGAFDFGRRVTIYATDVDQNALSAACRGIYDSHAISSVPMDLRDEYLTETDDGWRIRPGIRHSVTFLLQNVLNQIPEQTFDMIICRNTLIYFQLQAQKRVLNNFRCLLTTEGYLLLGQGEYTIFHDINRPFSDQFGIVDLDAHLYRRSAK